MARTLRLDERQEAALREIARVDGVPVSEGFAGPSRHTSKAAGKTAPSRLASGPRWTAITNC